MEYELPHSTAVDPGTLIQKGDVHSGHNIRLRRSHSIHPTHGGGNEVEFLSAHPPATFVSSTEVEDRGTNRAHSGTCKLPPGRQHLVTINGHRQHEQLESPKKNDYGTHPRNNGADAG